ncbi:hypothetical protein ACHAXR_011010 [Thalassiosira sp. AJA248-18]
MIKSPRTCCVLSEMKGIVARAIPADHSSLEEVTLAVMCKSAWCHGVLDAHQNTSLVFMLVFLEHMIGLRVKSVTEVVSPQRLVSIAIIVLPAMMAWY